MKKYSDITISGSLNLTGSFNAPDIILETTASMATSASYAEIATSASYAEPQVGQVAYKDAWNFNDAAISKDITNEVGFSAGTVGFSYTPKYTNSKLVVHVSADIRIGGSGIDTMVSSVSEITTNTKISEKEIIWGSSAGDYARRTSQISELAGVFYNTTLSQKTFQCGFTRVAGDDTMTCFTGQSMISIEEIKQ